MKSKVEFMKFVKNSDLFDEDETILDGASKSETPEVTPDISPLTTRDEEPKELSTSCISKDTKIIGNISSQGNLQIDGIIDGDIDCYHNLTVQGEVKGDIKASFITIKNANVIGDVSCEHLCNVVGNTQINGNISTESLMLEGSINGNITASEKVSLKTSSKLEGDCSAKSLVIEEGASIKGNINTNS